MHETRWTGELLWPQDLPDGEVIDISGVISLGTWVHAWLRAHPDRALVAGGSELRTQLTRAGVPVRWFDRADQVGRRDGVSASEREMLWN